MLGLTYWKMAKCKRQPSRHPTTVPQCASELPSHQAPPQWHCRHHCRHPTFSSQQSNQQTSLHSISPGHCSRNHSRVMFAASPVFVPDGGRWMGKGGLFHGQTQAVQVADPPQLSPGGVRKGSGTEKQQPQRASNNCWWKRKLEDVILVLRSF